MATIEKISEALKLVDEKKENLRKAFDELKSHSSSLSYFTLSWSDIDAHFSALHSTVLHKFDLLKSRPSVPNPHIEPSPSIKSENDGKERESVAARPELKLFCESMDGLGLRSFIIKKKPKERLVIGAELVDAFKCAPDAAAMVLDALEGFFEPNSKGDKDTQLLIVRKACVVMLESLMESKVEVSAEVRERAKSLALDWKNNVSVDGSSTFEPYGFLYLVAIYGLVDAFTTNDILDMAVLATKFAHSFRLLRVLCLGDMMSELIQKSISKGLQFQAVKCILEFKLADKFPPVPLLEAYVNEAKKNSQKIREDGKQCLQLLNEATTKELNALTSVVNIIKDHKLDAESLKQTLVKRIDELEKEKVSRKKQPQPPYGPKPKSKPQNLSGTKRPRLTSQAHLPNNAAFASSANPPTIHKAAAPHVAAKGPAVAPYQQPYSAAPTFASTKLFQQSYPQFVPGGEVKIPIAATTTSSTVPPYQLSYVQHTPGGQVNESASTYQQSYLQPSGLLPDHHTAYSSSSAGGLYGSAEASLGMVGSSTHAQSHAYATNPNTSSGYYDGSANYGGYAMPPPQYSQLYHQPQ